MRRRAVYLQIPLKSLGWCGGVDPTPFPQVTFTLLLLLSTFTVACIDKYGAISGGTKEEMPLSVPRPTTLSA
jgi:hypothetical protein